MPEKNNIIISGTGMFHNFCFSGPGTLHGETTFFSLNQTVISSQNQRQLPLIPCYFAQIRGTSKRK